MAANEHSGGWLVAPQKFNRKTSRLDIGRGYIRYAIRNRQILVFRLLKDETTSTGYKLDYRLSFNEPYLAISHSWTDRTGPGDSIKISDLAPWPITVSPAKIGLLDWLYDIQSCGAPWTSWYWMDLFCIDQTKHDERLFSQQLEQIPAVFFRAKSCLALLASRPCQEAVQLWTRTHFIAETAEDEHWDSVLNWILEHSKTCSCSPTLDSWLTRVWTRQEVLYSKDLTIVPATIWLRENFSSSSTTSTTSDDTWTARPNAYITPADDGGIRELASMLVTWDTKYGHTQHNMSSSRIANGIRLLLCGEMVRFSQPAEHLESQSQHEPSLEWHAFNWTMIVDGSIRYTSHIRDAILSQMLLLPGYRVPHEPWSMPLQELMADSCRQYRRELKRWQIVPMVTEVKRHQNGTDMLLPRLANSFENGSLCEILLSVGSPCVLPALLESRIATQGESSSLLLAYRAPSETKYKVVCSIDLVDRPHEAAEFVLSLQELWSAAAGCRTTSNVRACLEDVKEIQKQTGHGSDDDKPLKDALRHCIGRSLHSSPFAISDINCRIRGKVQYDDVELNNIEVPRLYGLELIHPSAQTTSTSRTLACGDLLVGEEGNIWKLGQDRTTKLEIGSIAEERQNGSLRLRASGILMTKVNADGGKSLPKETNIKFGHILP